MDSLQALRLGIEAVRFLLRPIEEELRFLGDPWLDLPENIPSGLGGKNDSRFRKVVESEMDRVSRENGDDPDALRATERMSLESRRARLLAALK
ncbi:hypothetical protein [Corallococcus sp. Z5C101001]|uniref:hypothetical protein n=1 Tax=Corallococcus sp. Z5C101001 TaxID=2596829 RepID=UPI00117D3CD3|nr:hypothetical protein [Corallococcus sp. Z5C101001]TSC32290.1 hypothetical protein FOF48_09600 [Corallococcus sp. Z5C101001]